MPDEPADHDHDHDPFEPPGGVLVWIVVFVELLTFAAGLIVFVVQANAHPASFQAGRAILNQPLALTNTFVLLTGGWCMANAINRLRAGSPRHAARWIAASVATALTFIALKTVEYAEKTSAGIGFGDDPFFTLYFLLTGFHLAHVAAAAVLLAVMWRGVRGGKYTRTDHFDVESSGIFWHLCDLVWLLLYPVVYLL